MDGGDEQAFLRSLDISANLNQEVRDVEEDVVLFQNQFLTCTVILTGDGKGVPFVNRPFESEIHGTVNFTQFCCVLLVRNLVLSCAFVVLPSPKVRCNK